MSNFLLAIWFTVLRFVLKLFHLAFWGYEYFDLVRLTVKRKLLTLINLPLSDPHLYVSEFVSKLEKYPSHLVVITGTDRINVEDFSNIVLWCLAAKISFISFYDYSGYLKQNEGLYYKHLLDKGKVDPKCLVFNLNNHNLKNGVSHKIYIRILSMEDGKSVIVKLAKDISTKVKLNELEVKKINEKFINSELLGMTELPEPELAIICGSIFSTFGFLPWHIRVTEFLHTRSIQGITVSEFTSFLRRYSSCRQRFGRDDHPCPLPTSRLAAETRKGSSKKSSKCRKLSDEVAKQVLAPFLRRLKKHKKIITSVEDEYQKHTVGFRIKNVISKLSFGNSVLEMPTVLNETAEILKEVTRSQGVNSYIVDKYDEHLSLNVKYLPRNGRHTVKYKIEPGKTLAAYVAYTQEYVLVDDILADERFPLGIPGANKTVKSALCIPVQTTKDSNCIAVIELFRYLDREPYKQLDLEICVAMTSWMGAALHQNSERIFLFKKNELSTHLASVVELFFYGSLTFDNFVSNITECAKMALQAERGSFYLMEEEVMEGTEDEIVADVYEQGIDSAHYILKKRNKQRFLKTSTGFPGIVARQGIMINVADVYKDPRFDRSTEMHGYLTRSLISVPLKGSGGVIGVLQIINKLDEPSFTKEDEILLQNIARYAYLACQHNAAKELYKKLNFKLIGNQELLKIQMKPCPDDLRYLRYGPVFRRWDMPNGFFNFDWIITGKEDRAPQYAVFMFSYLLGEQFFDYYILTEFVLTVKKSYRDNPYHNFAHAFTVCHCMFNIIHRNKESFTKLQILALLVSTLCHDCDHVGYTNTFLDMTNHWLSGLYWESPLEHHHYDICLLMVEGCGLFLNIKDAERPSLNKLIKSLILSTDLVQYFRNRSQMIFLLKSKTFDWDDPEHRIMFLGMVMTVCDVSGQCKPFYTAKKVTEGLYREFYNQGDVEKSLGFSPLAMMDRDKTSTIPENQIQFLGLVCIPSVEILVAVFPNTEQLLKQCVELKDCWSDILAKKVVEVWKMGDCIVDPRLRKRSTKKVVLK